MVMRQVGRKLLDVCRDCGKLIRIDKPIFGSLHVCSTMEERALYPEIIRGRVEAMEAALSKLDDRTSNGG